jgi:DNA-directed RNA polymerase specialized sigma24 family protein
MAALTSDVSARRASWIPDAAIGPLRLVPDDDPRFRDAVIMAGELFTPGGWGRAATPPGPVDVTRAMVAAQAMLRAAYPGATIVEGLELPGSMAGSWTIFRDGASLDETLLHAARTGDASAAMRLGDRYHAIAFVFAWMVCGEASRAMAAAADALERLTRSSQPVVGEDVGDTLLRLSREAALERRSSSIEGHHDPPAGARLRLAAMLRRLPAAQAMCVSLAYGQGLSEPAIDLALALETGRSRMTIRAGLTTLVEAPVGASNSPGSSMAMLEPSGDVSPVTAADVAALTLQPNVHGLRTLGAGLDVEFHPLAPDESVEVG